MPGRPAFARNTSAWSNSNWHVGHHSPERSDADGSCSFVFAKHDAGVVAAESKAVAHRDPDIAGDRMIGRVIEIAIGIGRLIIDRRCDRGGLDRLAKDHRFDAAAGTERMSQRTLGAADLGRLGMVAEDVLDRPCFGFVTERCAGAVGVDVIDIGWRDPRVLRSPLASRPPLRRPPDPVR